MSADWIKTRIDGDLYFVTIARAEKRNALTPQMIFDLATAVRRADEHPELRAVIVHGDGSVFSAGIDVMSLAESATKSAGRNRARALRRLALELQEALFTVEATELPIIGALHGHVVGLGLELALTFDLRVAADGLKLSIPESRMGLVADVGGSTRLSRTIGPSRAKDMLMTARAIEAEEALAWGLVNRVVPAGELMSAAIALARQIAANAPLAVGLAKLIVDQGDGLDKHSQMAIERWAQSQLVTTEDVGEAVASFVQKRPAAFKGR